MIKLIFSIVLTMIVGSAYAGSTSALEQLPFNIVIGETSNAKIGARGTCIKKLSIGSGYYRCESFDMNGNFFVESSQNEIAKKISFYNNVNKKVKGEKIRLNQRLPRKWTNAGLSWDMKAIEAMAWLKNQEKSHNDDYYIDTKKIAQKEIDGVSHVAEFHINFEVGRYAYSFMFWGYNDDYNKLKFRELHVEEAY
ncbi:hypothetical protein [Vibrio sp. HN007]|uniref:hypothetical protein n=1 Tax=Vibrio iocasae TaxID=3098914 RepID=UPI0035D455A3